MIKSTDDVKIYFITIPAHKFLHIMNYEVMVTGISGKSKVSFQDKTAKPFAVYWIVSKESWMIMAVANLTVAAVR